MPRSPRSTRPRPGRLGRSRTAGLPASAPGESSSRLLFTARLAPSDLVPEAAVEVPSDASVAVEPTAEPTVEALAEPAVEAAEPAVPAPAPPAAGPATRVHAEHLVRRSPKLHLTPSQAVRLASEGPAVLTRPRPKAS